MHQRLSFTYCTLTNTAVSAKSSSFVNKYHLVRVNYPKEKEAVGEICKNTLKEGEGVHVKM